MSPIHAVIFDYYETLARLTADLREQAFDRLASSLGVTLPPGEAYRHWRELTANDAAVRFDGVRPPLDGQAPPFRSFSFVWKARCEELFRLWKSNALPDIGAEACARAHAEACVYPDVQLVLDRLRDHHRLAVLSDADSNFLDESIRRNQLSFDAVVSSEDAGAYKPHVSMFQEICARLEIELGEATYVGDSPWADMAGARNAGMRAVWINRHGAAWPDDQEPPDATIRTLAELPALLEQQ